MSKAQDDLIQAVTNLAGSCGACAEIGMTGMTLHEHEGCVVAERNALRDLLDEAVGFIDSDMEGATAFHAKLAEALQRGKVTVTPL